MNTKWPNWDFEEGRNERLKSDLRRKEWLSSIADAVYRLEDDAVASAVAELLGIPATVYDFQVEATRLRDMEAAGQLLGGVEDDEPEAGA